METHITVLGVLYILLNAGGLVAAVLIFLLGTSLALFAGGAEVPAVVTLLASGLASCFLVLALPGIVGGIGLLQRKHWARILVIILGVLNLPNFPFGTLLGGYTLWVLLQDDATEAFGRY